MAFYVTLSGVPVSPPTLKQVFPSKLPAANVNPIRVARQDLKVRNKIEQGELKGSTTRRDAIFCLSATLLAALAGGDTSEARTVMKPETRRKIWEKLDKIREKAGVPKEKMDLKPEKEDKPEETSPQSESTVDEKPEENTETSPQNE